MIQYSVSWRDESGDLHLLQPFYDDEKEAIQFAKNNYVEYERDVIPWYVDDVNPRFACPYIERKKVFKAKKPHAKTPTEYEQLTLFDL